MTYLYVIGRSRYIRTNHFNDIQMYLIFLSNSSEQRFVIKRIYCNRVKNHFFVFRPCKRGKYTCVYFVRRVVEFSSYSDMKNALERLDDTELNGRRIRLVEDKRHRRSPTSSSRSICLPVINAISLDKYHTCCLFVKR